MSEPVSNEQIMQAITELSNQTHELRNETQELKKETQAIKEQLNEQSQQLKQVDAKVIVLSKNMTDAQAEIEILKEA